MSLSSAQNMMVQTPQTRVDCISHLLSRCLAILIAPSERLRSDVIKTFMSCSAGEETPSHLSHVKIPVQFTCSQCSGGECPFLAGGERLLLTQGDKVMCAQDLDWAAHRLSTCKNFSSFASLWLSTHLCTHLVYKAVSNSLRICLVLQKKPREMHY